MSSSDPFVLSEKNQFYVPSSQFSPDHQLPRHHKREMYEKLLLKTLVTLNETKDKKQTHPYQTPTTHPNTQEISKLLRQQQHHQTMHDMTTEQCSTLINSRTYAPAINTKTHVQNQHTTKMVMNKSRCWFNTTPLVIFSIFLISIIGISDWPTVRALQVSARFGSNALECSSSSDCGDPDKICHQEKCICKRDKPVEDTVNNKCLGVKNIGETCSITEQCLAQSLCLEGLCSCGDGIKVFNPSARIDYCHERKKLNETCSVDVQCPANAYCSMDRFGCLCANGYADSSGQCLPKKCLNSNECESEFHICQDNLCMCLADHFDLTTAKCYKFGSRDGLSEKSENGSNLFKDVFDDLKGSDGDNFWIVLIIIIVSVLLILSLLILLFKKHYLRFCFTSYKKEYEPNNKSAPKNGFHSNPINNKSFKRKLENDAPITNNFDRTKQSSDQLRKSSDVDVNLDINDTDEHEVMISGKINKPLVNPTSTTV